ncbi:MAG: YkvA family protein [Bacteroidota bacterium]
MAKKKNKYSNLKKIDEESFEEEVTYIDEEDVEILFENEEKIRGKFEKKSSLRKYLDEAKLMFEMLKDYRRGTYREVPWHSIGGIAVVLLYVLNPFDIIPDIIPGFGFVDDAGVFALGLKLLKQDFDRYKAWRGLTETTD